MHDEIVQSGALFSTCSELDERYHQHFAVDNMDVQFSVDQNRISFEIIIPTLVQS